MEACSFFCGSIAVDTVICSSVCGKTVLGISPTTPSLLQESGGVYPSWETEGSKLFFVAA